jgi:hypothetical protein
VRALPRPRKPPTGDFLRPDTDDVYWAGSPNGARIWKPAGGRQKRGTRKVGNDVHRTVRRPGEKKKSRRGWHEGGSMPGKPADFSPMVYHNVWRRCKRNSSPSSQISSCHSQREGNRIKKPPEFADRGHAQCGGQDTTTSSHFIGKTSRPVEGCRDVEGDGMAFWTFFHLVDESHQR